MTGTVVVTGANGFLGRYLTRSFARRGWEVVAVARRREGWSGDGMFLEWDGRSQGPWALALEGASAVINLAGRSVNCRYHPANRRAILESRVESTRAVGEAVVHLGGGRLRNGDAIDPRVGFSALQGLSAAVGPGAPLARVHAATEDAASRAIAALQSAYALGDSAELPQLVQDRVA